jgi:putative NADH-flavin reductase
VTGDATDPAAVARAAGGVDAVLVALGPGRDLKSDLASRSAQVLIKVLEAQARIVVLSAFGVGDSLPMASPLQRLMYRTAMRDLFADKARADAIWRDSGLDWTIVRPVTLTNGRATGRYAADERLAAKGFPRIARADVAQFMVAQAGSATWSRRTVLLTSRA